MGVRFTSEEVDESSSCDMYQLGGDWRRIKKNLRYLKQPTLPIVQLICQLERIDSCLSFGIQLLLK